MPILHLDVDGLGQADRGLRRFAATVSDLRPFWRELGERLADTAQRRWPLKRRTGKLRRSLTWAGSRLGRGGVFESSPDRLAYGSTVFYGRFHQYGAKNTPRRSLIHVDPAQQTAQLSAWLQERAKKAGLVTG